VVTAQARHSHSRHPRAVPIGSTSSRHRTRSSWPPRRPARALTATRRTAPRLGTATSFTAHAPASDIFLVHISIRHSFTLRSLGRARLHHTHTNTLSFILSAPSFIPRVIRSFTSRLFALHLAPVLLSVIPVSYRSVVLLRSVTVKLSSLPSVVLE
jgi:hypothetical protein